MDTVSHLLAESLASDNLWFALVFLAALLLMANLRARVKQRIPGIPDKVTRED